MSDPLKQKSLMPSIFDRLQGDFDDQNIARGGTGFNLSRLKQSVRIDLENLLNTRWRCTDWPNNLEELENSLINYGIPDFTGSNMSNSDHRESFRRVVEMAIRRFEPRFRSVRVALLDPEDEYDRTLRFRIDAELDTRPSPEPVVFDSRVDPGSNKFHVEKANT